MKVEIKEEELDVVEKLGELLFAQGRDKKDDDHKN